MADTPTPVPADNRRDISFQGKTTPFSFLEMHEERPPREDAGAQMKPTPLLAPAKSGVPVAARPQRSLPQIVGIIFGVMVVLVGAGDLAARTVTLARDTNSLIPRNTLGVGPLSGSFPIATTTAQAAIVPVRISIPSIGVDAAVESVEKRSNGEMEPPSDYKKVAWYSPGSKPGEAGNAVMAGHLNNSLSTAGVFEHLQDVRPGDTILISDASGASLTFVVVGGGVYPADNAPQAAIFATEGAPQLALITCDGAWNQGKKSFDDRLVIFARLASQ